LEASYLIYQDRKEELQKLYHQLQEKEMEEQEE